MKIMDTITQGVYVVGAKNKEGKKNLMTAAWVTQTSSRPNQVLVAISSKHYTAAMIQEVPCFTLSVLGEGQEEIAKTCGFASGRKTDKTALVPCACSWNDLPEIKEAAAVLRCEVRNVIEAGDHTLFIGEVVSGELGNKTPLKYDTAFYFG